MAEVKERRISREEALEAAAHASEMLKTRFGATRVIVFGSAAGQAPWHPGSDLDLAVEGIQPEEFFKAWSAVNQVLPPDLQVDLVDLRDASPELRARILGEVEMPEEPIAQLQSMIADELKTLERIAAMMAELEQRMHEPPDWIEMSAMAKLLHDFYNGVESIFERIAIYFDGGVPKTAFWHMDLLNQMNEPREGQRPAVVDDRLWSQLREFLEFRHFFRHAYGVELNWKRLSLLVVRMPEILDQLRNQLDQFFAALRPDEKDFKS